MGGSRRAIIGVYLVLVLCLCECLLFVLYGVCEPVDDLVVLGGVAEATASQGLTMVTEPTLPQGLGLLLPHKTEREARVGQGPRGIGWCVCSYCLCCLAVGLEGVHLMHQLRHTLLRHKHT